MVACLVRIGVVACAVRIGGVVAWVVRIAVVARVVRIAVVAQVVRNAMMISSLGTGMFVVRRQRICGLFRGQRVVTCRWIFRLLIRLGHSTRIEDER